jgi:hypothetical protein
MSTRKIKHWGKTSGEAFGRTGYKGMKGERWFADYYRSKGLEVIVYESSREKQLVGIDVVIIKGDGTTLSIDVKNNLKVDNSFFVETGKNGWLFNSNYENEYVSHVNPNTGAIAIYPRVSMQKYIEENYQNYSADLLRVKKEDKKLDFIRWTFTKGNT